MKNTIIGFGRLQSHGSVEYSESISKASIPKRHQCWLGEPSKMMMKSACIALLFAHVAMAAVQFSDLMVCPCSACPNRAGCPKIAKEQVV